MEAHQICICFLDDIDHCVQSLIGALVEPDVVSQHFEALFTILTPMAGCHNFERPFYLWLSQILQNACLLDERIKQGSPASVLARFKISVAFCCKTIAHFYFINFSLTNL